MTRRISLALAVTIVAATAVTTAAAQEPPPPIKTLYESARYQEVIDRAQGDVPPEDVYLAAQAYLKQQNIDGARGMLDRLTSRGEDPWGFIGRSERARIDQNLDGAHSESQAAVDRTQPGPDGAPPPMPVALYARYQLGVVLAQRQDMENAANLFQQAISLDPSFAYAHYYAGMAASRLNRPDQVAGHFQTFLQLAPNAPERGPVESMMRTIQGR